MTTSQTPTVLETYNALLAEKQELREAIRATQVDERSGTPLALATATAQRHELGVRMNAVDEGLMQLGAQARREQAELLQRETDDLLTDQTYRAATHAACLVLADQLEDVVLVAAMNASARKRHGLQMPPIPRMNRMQIDELLTYFVEMSRRGLFDLDDLSPAWRALLDGGGL